MRLCAGCDHQAFENGHARAQQVLGFKVLASHLQRIFQENRDRFWWVTCCKLIMFALRNQRLSCGYLYVPPRNNIRQSDGSLGQQLLAEWARLWDSLNAEVVSDTDLDGTD